MHLEIHTLLLFFGTSFFKTQVTILCLCSKISVDFISIGTVYKKTFQNNQEFSVVANTVTKCSCKASVIEALYIFFKDFTIG